MCRERLEKIQRISRVSMLDIEGNGVAFQGEVVVCKVGTTISKLCNLSLMSSAGNI